jgi:hypothetical protein
MRAAPSPRSGIASVRPSPWVAPSVTIPALPATAHDALDTQQDLITDLLQEFFG